ncbi:MAG: outer membrane protein assembly factor BamB family protein [Halobacteriota archaeon]
MPPLRRFCFFAAVLLIAMLFAGLIAVPGAAQSDTVQARYDAAHTADYSSVAGSTQPNDKLLWSVAVGEGASGDPTVANGVVYVTGGGAYNGTLYALNTATGLYKWKFPTGEYSMSSPAVSNGIVYVGTANGTLYALNATTGAKLWNYTVGGLFSPSPTVTNGVVYVNGRKEVGNKGVGYVYALNATTGAKLWNYSIDVDYYAPPATNGIVYVGTEDDNLYALNATTGAKLWNYSINRHEGVKQVRCFAVSNGIVYFGTGYLSAPGAEPIGPSGVYALNATTGAKLWNTSVKVPSFAAVSNGIVYVGSTDGNLYALNATTGAKLWNYSAGDTVASSPAVANGIVYWGGNNSLNALNATTGARLWNYTVGMYGGTPAVANGLVYFTASVPDKGNLLYAIGNASAATAQGRSSIPGFEVGIAVIALIIGALVASKKR